MIKYWFYGIMPKDAIGENYLSERQKEIITIEKEKLSGNNYQHGWLGFLRENKWEFMRHGFETIIVDEIRGNIARKDLIKLLDKKYGEQIK